jgi:uncharacterized protein (TIGR03905 family)
MLYRPEGVCTQMMNIEVKDGKIESVEFIGGCDGNTQGVARLLKGMSIDEAIEKLDGIKCGFKDTSCPDQLAQALKKIRDGELK